MLQAAQFYRGADFVSAKQTTKSSGITDLLHGSDIDEFVFEPCGYSMNGLQVRGAAFCYEALSAQSLETSTCYVRVAVLSHACLGSVNAVKRSPPVDSHAWYATCCNRA